MKLCNAALGGLPQGIDRPRYDRASLTPGIVHIGLGNFHRAHQAWYLHRLMQAGKALNWAILGAGVRPQDAAMREKLLAQDCLTTLIALDPAGRTAEVTGGMVDFLPVEPGNEPLVRAMADPAVRIVSLTVTEGGYYRDSATGRLDTAHPDILHDAAHPERPRTAFGSVVAALKHRRAAGTGPFTGLSCDNLQGNGAVLRQSVTGLARLSDPSLAEWIDSMCSFPNSMVDCITPATGPEELSLVQDFGIDDLAPVTHETFRQWVIEDDFCAGRPDWEDAGATFTDSVHAYETMKIRILNGGHQVLANVGELLSIETIAACMSHPLISRFFRKVQSEEIVPHVAAVPGTNPAAYLELIETRFANPAIRDTVRRVAFDGSSRHPGFVLPILRDALAGGGPVEGLGLVEAFWARMCAGTREDGADIPPNDPHWASLVRTAESARERPQVWLEQREIYGGLADSGRFSRAFEKWLTFIWAEGCEAALQSYCEGRAA